MFHHDLHSLRLFVAICELRSLSKAAERVDMALSAASRRLKLLEEEVGAPLVKRLPHGLELTMAGITVERYAQSVLRMADQLAANLEEHRSGLRGRIRLHASSSVLVQKLAEDLASFARENPDIKIDLEERPAVETIDALSRKQTDVGVIVRGVMSHGFDSFAYTQDRLAVAVYKGHHLAGRSSVKFADLFDEEFVSFGTTTAAYHLLASKVREAGRILNIRVQVRSFEVMCRMVQYHLGIGILPELALRPLAAALGLDVVCLDETWATRDIDVVAPAFGALDPPAARLIEMLRASADVVV
jgi:DNA-binding transcriptional LysR family regulator